MAKKKTKTPKMTGKRTVPKSPRKPAAAARRPVKRAASKPGTAAPKKAPAARSPNRMSWLSDADLPQLDAQVQKLAHFTRSMADGVIDKDELATQEKRLVSAMKAVEGELSDADHARVTNLLVELTAYNVMQVLHGLAVERARVAFG